MALPISSVVNVSVSISPTVPPKQGFGTAALVTDENTVLGAIQVQRVVFYGSITEVAVDWATSTDTYKSANAYFAQNPSPVQFATIKQDSLGGESEVDALAAAELFSSGWYGILLLPSVRDTAEQINVGVWAEARTKIFSAATENPLTLTIGDVTSNAALAAAQGLTRTSMAYSGTSGEFIDAAVLGKAFTTNFSAPDSVITLKFKDLATITTEDINSNEKKGLDEKRCNALVSIAGASIFAEGYMSSQLFFDERHSVDWLVGEIESNVFGYLVSRTTKVPLTDRGGAAIEQQVTRALDAAVNNGMLAPGEDSNNVFLPNGYQVTVQRVADMNPTDIANRIGSTINFVALLAGAMHFIQITGTVER